MTAHVPEAVERARELKSELGITERLELVEGRAEIVVLSLEPVEPLLRIAAEFRIRLLGESDVVLDVAPAELISFAGRLELLDGVFTDRLQHPEALLTVAKEALVD